MATKKNYRSDNTYMLDSGTGDNPKLGAKVLSNGRESLFLDFYFGYTRTVNEETGKDRVKINRKREHLGIYLYHSPRDARERRENKEMLERARRIRYERERQMAEDGGEYKTTVNRGVNFLGYFQSYYDGYSKKDKSVVKMALRRFTDFLNGTPGYEHLAGSIKPAQITKELVSDFAGYLQTRSRGGGAKAVFARFKKVVLHAVEHDVMAKNPCLHVSVKADTNMLTKDILSQDEMRLLMATRFDGENREVRRAFLFCLYTGLRYCDVKELVFSNIDFSNKLLKYEQNKTRGRSSASGVVTPLNDGLLRLVEGQKNGGGEIVFALPSYSTCLKKLECWVKAAGIEKHITWHCARHSFATNILSNGANIKTVASLLGHSSLQCTEKYARAVDALKKEAVNSLPELDF